MKKKLVSLAFAAALMAGTATVVHAWGFWAHKRINRLAVFTLPDPLKGFYEKHIDSISERAIVPDLRRNSDKNEASRHYIDADYYGKQPFQSLPQHWADAVKKYTADTLKKYGINPWYVNQMKDRLTAAFKAHNIDSIVFLSADLGHYVGDAHVPLHASMNYDGQLSGQKGIHGLWEARVPELVGSGYNYYAGKAKYIKDIQNEAWQISKGSFSEVDSVLSLEKGLNDTFPQDKKYLLSVNKDGKPVKQYTDRYTKEYSALLHGMVERRLRAAINEVGSFWYTAWVNAGKPDMSKWDKTSISKEMASSLKEEEKLYRNGKALEKVSK
jgi:hypothetical protein